MTTEVQADPYKTCIEMLREEIERGREFIHFYYYKEGNACALGFLAQEAGVDDDLLIDADKAAIVGPKKMATTNPDPESRVAADELRQKLINHYDGEDEERFTSFLRSLQKLNDDSTLGGSWPTYEFDVECFMEGLDHLERRYSR